MKYLIIDMSLLCVESLAITLIFIFLIIWKSQQ